MQVHRVYRLYEVHVYVHEGRKRGEKGTHVYLHIHTASDHYSVVRSAVSHGRDNLSFVGGGE